MDDDHREVEKSMEEATRIQGVRIEVEHITKKLQRYVRALNMPTVVLRGGGGGRVNELQRQMFSTHRP